MSDEWSDKNWETQQLKDARLAPHTAAMVRRLLAASRNGSGTHKVNLDLAIDTFAKLVRGHALVVPDLDSEVWTQITRPGDLRVRDVVRVRRDAYSDGAGRMHNGRRGRVIAVRYGDVVIRYEDGRQPPFDGVHHPPMKLEKLTHG